MGDNFSSAGCSVHDKAYYEHQNVHPHVYDFAIVKVRIMFGKTTGQKFAVPLAVDIHVAFSCVC